MFEETRLYCSCKLSESVFNISGVLHLRFMSSTYHSFSWRENKFGIVDHVGEERASIRSRWRDQLGIITKHGSRIRSGE